MMRTELPVCLRCCFCFPLRYGLIAFGYFKLIVAAILLISLLVTLCQGLAIQIMYTRFYYIQALVIICVLLLILVIDSLLHVVFVVGAHKKQVNLLKIYYFYSKVLWVLMVIISIVCIGILISTFTNEFDISYVPVLVVNGSLFFIYHVVHIYIVLLARSEMIKLKNVENFRYVNNTAEADSTIKIDESSYEKETDNENFIEKNETVVFIKGINKNTDRN